MESKGIGHLPLWVLLGYIRKLKRGGSKPIEERIETYFKTHLKKRINLEEKAVKSNDLD